MPNRANELEAFAEERKTNLHAASVDEALKRRSLEWMLATSKYSYSYNFDWLGIPIIQFPQDILALQQVIWSVRPEVIIETGVAHGGSAIFYASMLELVGEPGLVIGIDVDIRPHNRARIVNHRMSRRIHLIEGSSTDERVVAAVHEIAEDKARVMVVLDSNHTAEHVALELESYQGLVRDGSYLIVFDTSVEDVPAGFFADRNWGPGNSPRTAVDAFLDRHDRFIVDENLDNSLLISSARGGYLRCVGDPN
jgi:cephalosporin hydroxylase